MKIVYGYNSKDFLNPKMLAHLVGKKFKSYDQITSRLNKGDTVTVEVAGKGYKSIGITEDGTAWIQRNFVYEY